MKPIDKLVAPAINTTSVEQTGASSALKVQTIGCVTRSRVDGLKRCLASYMENNQQFGRTNDFAIMDDSPDSGTRNLYRQALKSLARQYGVSISYAGLEEKIIFAKRLIDTKRLPPKVVKFALFDVDRYGLVSIGANLNALLLHTLGAAILSVDDDTVCRLAQSPDLQPGVKFSTELRFSSNHPCQFYSFPDRETAMHSAVPVDKDLLWIHEQLLGLADNEFPGEPLPMNGAPQAVTLSPSRRQSKGRVRVTFNGLMGDCGWGSPFYYLLLTGDSFERLIASETVYQASCVSRNVLKVVNQITISDRTSNMMATFFGLDNTALLPPFIPITRGADYVFGVTLSQCFGDSLFAHLPYTLLHLPVEPRAFSPGEIFRNASGIDIDALVSILIRACEVNRNSMTGEENLMKLGLYLQELGAAQESDFLSVTHKLVLDESAQLIKHFQRTLEERNYSPAFWAKDVEKYMAIMEQHFRRPESAAPLDLMYDRTADEGLSLAQSLVHQFGQLLYWWPEMLATTRALREEGHRIGQPV
jgi:hypothetical protein